MLKSSLCSVTFPINGLSLSSEITFQPGITAVVGRNGTGKTFKTIELWRYLLFGKKALRGPASDYKSLKAEGIVAIRGVDYEIKRSAKSETITVVGEDDAIAVGADAVNKKITEILGFGLEVFDICNASVQKQSNRLTQLTPAKRKELIDDVAGLSHNERVEKECKEKAKLLKLEADTIRENVTEPVPPVEPEGYRPSQELEAELKQARQLAQQREQLELVASTHPVFPEKPVGAAKGVEYLEKLEAHRIRTEARRTQLRATLDRIPTTSYTAEQIKAGEAWAQYDAEVARRGPQPEISRGLAETELTRHAQAEIMAEVECPKCGELFCPGNTVVKSEYPKAFLQEQLRRNDAWDRPLSEPAGERIPHDELQKAHAAIVRADERAQLEAELVELPDLDDRSAELAQQREINQLWQIYHTQFEHAQQAENKRLKAEDDLQKLPPLPDIPALDAAFVAARIYEAAVTSFDKNSTDYADKMTKAAELSEKAEDFLKGAKRLAEARREAKAHLAPSLSRIASALIYEMTCGKLTSVHVDDDMNVTVNGQDVATLSGAGETAANLALRLALGRTLVGGVFPVFMGDEIDADADEERSEATFECLRNLRGQFDQVIIITHKPHVTADHVIDMDA